MKSSDQIEAEGGPAFSYACGNPTDGGDLWPGMTLRDWFAGQALAGIATEPCGKRKPSEWARFAYETADEMLASRAQ